MRSFLRLALGALIWIGINQLPLIHAGTDADDIFRPISCTDPTNCIPSCDDNGQECVLNKSCYSCKCGYSYVEAKKIFVCGTDSPCLKDGFNCSSIELCGQCCNGAFADGGRTCGGQCLKPGVKCDQETTCPLCCNYQYYWLTDDKYYCGCIANGRKCVPGENCDRCCNGAYLANGYKCGGTCLPDGRECKEGSNCHLCCNGSFYWFMQGKTFCGSEPCYPDGTRCKPLRNCWNCCNGAYAGNGEVCGGTCLKDGVKCRRFSSCSKCCGGFYWDDKTAALRCGLKPCLANGTSCTLSFDCGDCCSSAFSNNGTKCGGECLKEGSKCEYFSTCRQCCDGSYYLQNISSHVCGYTEFPGRL